VTIGHDVSSIVESVEVSDCMDIELEFSLRSWSFMIDRKYRLFSEESDVSEESDMLVEFKSVLDVSVDERTMCFLFFEFKVWTRSIKSK